MFGWFEQRLNPFPSEVPDVPPRGLFATTSAPLSNLPSTAVTTRPVSEAPPEGTFAASGSPGSRGAGRCACGLSNENARSTTQSGTIARTMVITAS